MPTRNLTSFTPALSILSGWLALFLLALAPLAQAAPESVRLHYRKIDGFPVKFVTVNLNDPDVVVTPVAATTFPRGLESWGSFLRRLQPDAAINGTYFCLKTNMPVGDVAIEGNLVYKGVVGTALCLTPDNQAVMRPGPRQAKPDWRGFQSVLCAGPRLLTDGQPTINARAEGFRDPRVLGSAPRSAVAVRADGTLILLTIETSIALPQLAAVCRQLGAVQAMALDGGNSSGLYANGRTVTTPGRGLSNILAVYSSRDRYLAARAQLMPGLVRSLGYLLSPAPVSGPPTYAPIVTPIPIPATPRGPLLRLTQPTGETAVRGTVPVAVEVTAPCEVKWVSLRINGRLRAMSNTWPFQYHWDSTTEADGLHTLEITGWAADQSLVAKDVRLIRVQNGTLQATGE